MKVIYIAGPYRAPSEWEVVQNIRRAEEAAVFVWQNGGAALCPHKNTALFGGVPGCEDRVWLEGDKEMLIRCDAVLTVTGWERSSGACEEVRIAGMNNIPVFHTHSDLLDYLMQHTQRITQCCENPMC